MRWICQAAGYQLLVALPVKENAESGPKLVKGGVFKGPRRKVVTKKKKDRLPQEKVSTENFI